MTDERLKEIEAQAKSPVTHELIAEIRRCWGIMEGVRAAIWNEGQRGRSTKSAAAESDSEQEMIDAVLEGMDENNSSREFVLSLQAGLEKYGKLTAKQRAALEKFYQRAKR